MRTSTACATGDVRTSGSPSVRHIRLTLDPEVVLERLILAQITRRSRTRAQHWLRSVLVQGYLAEGKWLQGMAPSEDGRTGALPARVMRPTPYGEWCARAAPSEAAPAGHSVSRTQDAGGPSRTHAGITCTPPWAGGIDKPFANLRRVIG